MPCPPASRPSPALPAQYAQAGRSACHVCHGKIAEGQLRFGADVSGKEWQRGSHWFHWCAGCCRNLLSSALLAGGQVCVLLSPA